VTLRAKIHRTTSWHDHYTATHASRALAGPLRRTRAGRSQKRENPCCARVHPL